MSIEAMKLAAEFNRYFTSGNGVDVPAKVSVSRDEWRALFAAIQQAEVTDGIRPEDFTVDVVVKPMGGFAPVNTQGVRVTHKPTGVSVTCDAARSQHTNRHQAFEKLSAILAPQPAQVLGEPATVAVDHFDNGPFEAYTNRIHPPVEIGTKLYTHQAPSVPKDDQIAALVNKVRDIARMFHDHQSLRERIAIELVPAIKASQDVKSNSERVPMTDEQRNDLICTVTTLGAKLSRQALVGMTIDWTESHHGITAQEGTNGEIN